MTGYLHTVTITGADCDVDPARLIEISAEYPYVEWGVLKSEKHSKIARYPDWEWRKKLFNLRSRAWESPGGKARLSMHTCGRLARLLMCGARDRLIDTNGFGRVQLNGWSQYRLPGLAIAESGQFHEFIAQATSGERFKETCDFIEDHGYQKSLSVLWDPSGDRGISSGDWPPPRPGVRTGYAGGIHAGNVDHILYDLAKFETEHWIDMESGVRTDDRFDLRKVVEVLERCRPYVREEVDG